MLKFTLFIAVMLLVWALAKAVVAVFGPWVALPIIGALMLWGWLTDRQQREAADKAQPSRAVGSR